MRRTAIDRSATVRKVIPNIVTLWREMFLGGKTTCHRCCRPMAVLLLSSSLGAIQFFERSSCGRCAYRHAPTLRARKTGVWGTTRLVWVACVCALSAIGLEWTWALLPVASALHVLIRTGVALVGHLEAEDMHVIGGTHMSTPTRPTRWGRAHG